MHGLLKMIFLLVILFGFVQYPNLSDKDSDDLAKTWAFTKMNGMSLDEKIGQLFMIQAYSNKGDAHRKKILQDIEKYHVGGISFFQGTAEKQASLTMEFQQASNLPMLIAMDAEWGPGMRLENTISFPRQFTLGAIRDNRLIYDMGKMIGRQLQALGVHMNFAPVIDINTEPLNPVIGDRSFGENKKDVARKSYAYMKGMQDEGVFACAKHFPGHGSTKKDSHLTLPIIDKSLEELEEIELFPFKLLFQQGVKSVMIGHLHIPALDDRKNRPSSLSDKIVTGLVRNKMKYDGLILTDALEMQGVAGYFKKGEIEVEAFLAGNDILTVSQNLPLAFMSVKNAVLNGRISDERLNKSVLRILMAKFDAGLFFPPEFGDDESLGLLNGPHAKALKEDLFRHAITYLEGENGNLPILNPASRKVATVSIGSTEKTAFQKRVDSYTEASHFYISTNANNARFDQLYEKIKNYDLVLVSFDKMNKRRSRSYGISQSGISFIRKIQNITEVYVALFGSPYSLRSFSKKDNIILAYQNDPMAGDLAAQALFGSFDLQGYLPVSPGNGFKYGQGKQLSNANVLSYGLAENVGLSSDSLARIDLLVDTILKTGAAPGCQVIVARHGQIVYDKSFGYHTYDKQNPVKPKDIYDLASITKVMATTLSTMKLHEDGLISIFQPVSDYVQGDIDSSDKKEITIIEALTHHAGLKPWIPFYTSTLDTLKNGKILPSASIYRKLSNPTHHIKVAENMYMNSSFLDTINKQIVGSELRENKDYKYSDLGLFLVKDAIESASGKKLDEFAREQFYDPMDLVYTGFNPLDRIDGQRIVPSENDDYFRMQELRGYVHDMGAAMLGGVSGHAGLFSNSKDVAVIMQMLLNNGVYGNKRYFDQNTVYTFTTRYHRSSRRGIGFDMKELDNKKRENMSELAPASTFGHYGFTGTCAFADPDNNIVYVFLSNRTYPSMKNNKLGKEDYRSKIQTIIYESIID